MEKYDPSTVTLDEAVAKLIGFESLPETITLIDALEYLIDISAEDFLGAQEEGADTSILARLKDEWLEWTEMKRKALRLFTDLERSIEQEDPYLDILATDTCRVRLSTQGVHQWAEARHQIDIRPWREYRGQPRVSTSEIDLEYEERRQLFASVMWLTDELLSRAWRNWKRTTPDIAPKNHHKYFIKDKPNVSAISQDIATALDNPQSAKKDPDNTRTITKHIDRATKSLTHQNSEDGPCFTKKQRKAAYKTLVGLIRLLNTEMDIFKNGSVVPDTEIKKAIDGLSVTSDQIYSSELANCLAAALRPTDDRDT